MQEQEIKKEEQSCSLPVPQPKKVYRKRRRRRKATVKEKEFAQSFIKHKGDLEAAADEVYASPDVIIPEILTRTPVRSEIARILEGVGLGEDTLARKLYTILFPDLKGHGVGHKEENEIKALRMAFELHGSFAPLKVSVTEENPYDKMSVEEIKGAIREHLKSLGEKEGAG